MALTPANAEPFNTFTGACPAGTAPTGAEILVATQGGVSSKFPLNVAITDASATLANKPAVALVATTNIALNGLQTIDGVVGAANTLTLLTGQTAPAENGPWQQQVAAWTRPTWYASGNTKQAFQFITTFVRLGSQFAGSTWRVTTAGAITIDTTGTAWSQSKLANGALAGTIDVQNFTASGTWTKPTTGTPKAVQVLLIGGGGSGGGGITTVSGVSNCGGSGGGAGFINLATFPDASVLGATETVTIGAGGAGVAAGASGNGGGQSSFGSWLQAFGGGGGSVGQSAANGGAGGSGGSRGAGGNATTATQGTAGSIGGVVGNTTAPNYYQSSGGGSGINGGQGSGSPNFSAIQGCTGGGSGAGLATVPVALSAGNGGFCQGGSTNNQGIAPGGNGINAVASVNLFLGSQGAGGGASNIGAGTGGQGGAGVNGSGGGGGGSALSTGTAGAGGAGGAGLCVVVTYF